MFPKSSCGDSHRWEELFRSPRVTPNTGPTVNHLASPKRSPLFPSKILCGTQMSDALCRKRSTHGGREIATPAFPSPRADRSLDISIFFPELVVPQSIVSPMSWCMNSPAVSSFPSSKDAIFVLIRDRHVVSTIVVPKPWSRVQEPGMMMILLTLPDNDSQHSATVISSSNCELLFCKPVTDGW